MDADPATLGAVAVSQSYRDDASGAMRCDHVLTITRPAATWTSAWTLLPHKGESSLILCHAVRVVSSSAPLTLALELERLVVDANRRAEEKPEEVFSVPTPPLPRAVSNAAGQYEVLLLTDECLVTRSTDSAPATLRIFERRPPAELLGEPPVAPAAVRLRARAPVMMAARRGSTKRPASAAPRRGQGDGGGSGGKISPKLAESVYYGLYLLFFGKLLLALIERASS